MKKAIHDEVRAKTFKWPSAMAIITSTINTRVYIEILDRFLIPSIEKWLCVDAIIFQDGSALFHGVKTKAFIQKASDRPDLNPIESLW